MPSELGQAPVLCTVVGGWGRRCSSCLMRQGTSCHAGCAAGVLVNGNPMEGGGLWHLAAWLEPKG